MRQQSTTARRIFVLGSANMDLVIRVERFPRPGETIIGSDLALHPGGKGANQAVAGARLGGEVTFLGAVGKDEFGDQLLGALNHSGVEVSRVHRSLRPSGCASIHVDRNGENSIVLSPGANSDISAGYVRHNLQGLTANDFLLLQLEIPIEAVKCALEIARQVGAATILDPAPACHLDPAILRMTTFLTPNETEAQTLLDGTSNLSIRETCDRLLNLGPATVILKLGGDGCAVRVSDRMVEVAPYAVETLDTTAAGDVFNAGLAVALAEGRSITDAAQFVNGAAALSVTKAGAQSSAPSRDMTERFIRDHAPVSPNKFS